MLDHHEVSSSSSRYDLSKSRGSSTDRLLVLRDHTLKPDFFCVTVSKMSSVGSPTCLCMRGTKGVLTGRLI